MFQVEIRGFADVSTGHHVQLFARSDMLDNARNVSKPHVPKRVGAVAAVVEDDPVLGTNGIEEIGTKTNCNADDAHEIAGRRVVFDIAGLQPHRPEEA